MKRPHNIVVVVADSWRGDVLGHVGNPAAVTPNLDSLVASDAVSFTSTFSQGAVCTPSRCSFLTGWYPHVRGHRTQQHRLHADEPHFFKNLRRNGYTVWWGGSGGDLLVPEAAEPWDVQYTPETHPSPHPFGIDPHHWLDWRPAPGEPGYYSFFAGTLPGNLPDGRRYDADWYKVDGAIDWLRTERPEDQPFCLSLNLTFPHLPYGVEEEWLRQVPLDQLPERTPTPTPEQRARKPAIANGLIDRLDLHTLPEDWWQSLRRTYYAMCARVDHQVGLLVDALRESGAYDDTAIFFFSDHGDYTGDFGLVEKNQNTFEDPIVRVPLIIKPPAGVPVTPGTHSALVELVDVSATIEDLAEVAPTHTTFGRSLVPLLADPNATGRDAVFCEGGRLHGERHCMELEARQDAEGLYYPRMSLQREEGPEHGKAVMCRTHDYKYVYRLYERDELYDLTADPGELDNRVDDPELGEVAAGFRDRILRFHVETADVVPPIGA